MGDRLEPEDGRDGIAGPGSPNAYTPAVVHHGPDAMLLDFFYTLRAARLPVSVKEYLTLLEAIQADVIGPSVAKGDVANTIAKILDVYTERREDGEDFLHAVRRLGIEPFKERVYAKAG
jgi:uncharacterized protein with von Willebrand factor type A (vWA) domain